MDFNAERGAAADAEEGATAGASVKADDPSLADMTRAALSILLKNDKGGRIDHAHHYNNPYRALDETLELETALLAALERVNPAETLIVVDHAHVMMFGGQATPRGHPVLGDFFPEEYRIKDEPDPDVRVTSEEADKMVEPRNEFYDDEKDNDKETVVPENKEQNVFILS